MDPPTGSPTTEATTAHDPETQPGAALLKTNEKQESDRQESLEAPDKSISQASTENPKVHVSPWSRKFLLSLDGGGIRGYSTLLIIQALMLECKRLELQEDPGCNSSYHPIGFQRSQGSTLESNSSQFLPVHYFDYIAGTSTGGLIAIMLGRLRMSIDDCIEEYAQIGAQIFGKPRMRSMRGPILWNQEKYDHRNLEAAVKKVVKRWHQRADHVTDPIFASTSIPNRCRTLVVAVRENNSSTAPFLFRTYEHPASETPDFQEINPGVASNVPIWQVARATTAAPTYFKPIQLNDETYLDGGWGRANNPTWHAYAEVQQMTNNPSDGVALTVSIGTGKPSSVPPSARRGAGLYGKLKAYIKYSISIATDSENTHINMSQLAQSTGHHYERLNVDRGDLGDMDLGAWKIKGGENKTIAEIRRLTEEYLVLPETQAQIRCIAEILVRNRRARSLTSMFEVVATGHRHVCKTGGCDRNTTFDSSSDLRQHLIHHHGILGERQLETLLKKGKILHAD